MYAYVNNDDETIISNYLRLEHLFAILVKNLYLLTSVRTHIFQIITQFFKSLSEFYEKSTAIEFIYIYFS